MKNKFIGLFVIIIISTIQGNTQHVNGKWYGVGNVYMNGENNSYLSELLLQQNGSKVSGLFNYFFKDHHISSQITGTYNHSARLLVLHLLPVLNYSAKNVQGADCSMVGAFTLKVSKIDATLAGAFTPTNQHRFTCPDILVKFKKSATEEIITKLEKKPLILEEEPAPIVLKKVEKDEPVIDLYKRKFETKEIEIYSDSISVSLYDNSEIDFDTVSLFYNKKLIAYKKMLSDKPIKFTLAVDSLEEISMFAENLGKLPPNTALLLVYDGDRRHEISISSDYVKNGTIRFRKVKPKEFK